MPLKSRSAASTRDHPVTRRTEPRSGQAQVGGKRRRRLGGRTEVVEVDPVVHHRPALRYASPGAVAVGERGQARPARRRSPPCSGWRPRPPAAPGGGAAGQRPMDVVERAHAGPSGQRGRRQGEGHGHLQVRVHHVRAAASDERDQPAVRRWGPACGGHRGTAAPGRPRAAVVRAPNGPALGPRMLSTCRSSPASAATRPSWAIKVSAPPRRNASTTVRTRNVRSWSSCTWLLTSPRSRVIVVRAGDTLVQRRHR